MLSDTWNDVDGALDRAADAGATIDLWMRDDDAVTATVALDRLTDLCETHAMPLLLAVIPAPADRRLAAFVRDHPLLTPTQHGYAHLNHAAPGERAREMGGDRPLGAVLAELDRGRRRLADLFGAAMTDILVPPWNRIDEALLPHLPALGFGCLSAFDPGPGPVAGLETLHCDLDIIDWRNGRRCHPESKLVGKLVTLIEARRPIGLLTHHLAHDDAAWTFLDRALSRLAAHGAVRFAAADTLREKRRKAA